jgi:hypothetical protein
MAAEVIVGWNVFKEVFPEHWEGFNPFRPRYDTPSYADLVGQRLRGGKPDQRGAIEYRCLHGGQGKPLVAMSCQSSLCLRCAQVSGDDWGTQVGTRLHEGVLSRPMVLTVPEVVRTTCYQNAPALRSPFRTCGVTC